MYRILLVEDDKAISRLLELELKHEGYETKAVYDGNSALEEYENFKPDIILLDVMLPIRDGFEVAEIIRNYDKDIGIIMLTAKGDLEDKVKGLKTTDDYIPKPFEIEEVLARIESLLRRLGKTRESIKVGDLEMFPKRMQIFIKNEEIHLSLTEFNILKTLLLNKNIVVSKNKIMNEVWGYSEEENKNLVEVYMNYLRKKIIKSDNKIETVRGVGYVIREQK